MAAIHEGPFQNIKALSASSFWIWPINKDSIRGWGYPWGDGVTKDPETGELIPIYGTVGGAAPHVILQPSISGDHRVYRWPQFSGTSFWPPVVATSPTKAGVRGIAAPGGPISWDVTHGDIVGDPYYAGWSECSTICWRGHVIYQGNEGFEHVAGSFYKGFVFAVVLGRGYVKCFAGGPWAEGEVTAPPVSTQIMNVVEATYPNLIMDATDHWIAPLCVKTDGSEVAYASWNIYTLETNLPSPTPAYTNILKIALDVTEETDPETGEVTYTPTATPTLLDVTAQLSGSIERLTGSMSPPYYNDKPAGEPGSPWTDAAKTIAGPFFNVGSFYGSGYTAAWQAYLDDSGYEEYDAYIDTAESTPDEFGNASQLVKSRKWCTQPDCDPPAWVYGPSGYVAKRYQYMGDYKQGVYDRTWTASGSRTGPTDQLIAFGYRNNVMYALAVRVVSYSHAPSVKHTRNRKNYGGDWDSETPFPDPVINESSTFVANNNYTFSTDYILVPIGTGGVEKVIGPCERTVQTDSYNVNMTSTVDGGSHTTNVASGTGKTSRYVQHFYLHNANIEHGLYILEETVNDKKYEGSYRGVSRDVAAGAQTIPLNGKWQASMGANEALGIVFDVGIHIDDTSAQFWLVVEGSDASTYEPLGVRLSASRLTGGIVQGVDTWGTLYSDPPWFQLAEDGNDKSAFYSWMSDFTRGGWDTPWIDGEWHVPGTAAFRQGGITWFVMSTFHSRYVHAGSGTQQIYHRRGFYRIGKRDAAGVLTLLDATAIATLLGVPSIDTDYIGPTPDDDPINGPGIRNYGLV